jgi:hypothetical protein
LSVLLLVVLVVASAVFVVVPFGRSAHARLLASPGAVEAVEERDRALAALRELELDHRAGTVDDAEYRSLVGALRVRAAEALRRIDGNA